MVPIQYPDFFAGEVSKPLDIKISPPPVHGITITPLCPGLTFTPEKWELNNKEFAKQCTVTVAADAKAGSYTVKYTLDGPDVKMYEPPSDATVLLMQRGLINISDIPALTLGEQVGPISITFSTPIINGLQIVPSAACVSFEPAKFKLKPEDRHCQFSVTLSSAPTENIIPVTFTLSGPDRKVFMVPLECVIRVKAQGKINLPEYPVLDPCQVSDNLSITLTVEPPNCVYVIPSSRYLIFKPSKLKFTNRTNRLPTFTVQSTDDVPPGPQVLLFPCTSLFCVVIDWLTF
jgi:hypothetical protein